MVPVDVPVEQRLEFNQLLEQLHRAATELDSKLPMVFVLLKHEEVVKKLIAIVSLHCLPWLIDHLILFILDHDRPAAKTLDVQRYPAIRSYPWKSSRDAQSDPAIQRCLLRHA